MPPNMDAILTPRFFDADFTLWESTTATRREGTKDCPPFQLLNYATSPYTMKTSDNCQWQTHTPTKYTTATTAWQGTPTTTTTTATTTARQPKRVSIDTQWTPAAKVSAEPPQEVTFVEDFSDTVSLLNDDPDDDDVGLLPHSTCNVLAPLWDAMYKDESEYNDDSDDEEGSSPL